VRELWTELSTRACDTVSSEISYFADPSRPILPEGLLIRNFSVARKGDGCEEGIFSLARIESCVLNYDRHVRFDQARIGCIRRNFFWMIEIIKPQMLCSSRSDLEVIRANGILVLKENCDRYVCRLIRRVENATRFMARHFRCRSLAFRWNVTLGNRPGFSANRSHQC
jgi:hypothetical protein